VREIRWDGVGIARAENAGFIPDRELHHTFEHDAELLVWMLMQRNGTVGLDGYPVCHEGAAPGGLHRDAGRSAERNELGALDPDRSKGESSGIRNVRDAFRPVRIGETFDRFVCHGNLRRAAYS